MLTHAHARTHTHVLRKWARSVRDQLRPVEEESEVTPDVKAAVTGASGITGYLVTAEVCVCVCMHVS